MSLAEVEFWYRNSISISLRMAYRFGSIVVKCPEGEVQGATAHRGRILPLGRRWSKGMRVDQTKLINKQQEEASEVLFSCPWLHLL